LNAGDTVICDSAYTGAYNLVADSKLVGLKIPRMRIGVLLPHMTRFAGAKLDKDPLALRLLSGYLTGTLDVDLSDGPHAARLHQDHIIDLVALALGTEGESRVIAEQRGAQAVRRAAVIQVIEASMADPALDATTVAARLLCDPGQSQRRIADIAFEVGFRDLSYFNRMFRRKYGGTPTELRHAAGDPRPPS